MKKYLMIGFAAIAFASCSNHDFETMTQEQIVKAEYDAKFIATFGQPSRSQTWGFGASTRAFTRSGNTSGDYTPWPYTHGYFDADNNLIASANMNRNQWGSTDLQSMPFGGWIVPDPLSPEQKYRVMMYFQNVTDLGWEDPQYANFFVQQVYTGGTNEDVTTGNREQNVAADGKTVKTGADLNQLTVGAANSHINDFNSGTCTTATNVLNHEGKTQSDQITLMLNVDDTSCFGYHETSGSNVPDAMQHNDKMKLVSAATIDAWAEANNIGGAIVDDKWHRSFMGFDYEMLPESAIIPENPTYAKISDVPSSNNFTYAVLDGKVMTIGTAPEAIEAEEEDITSTFATNVTGQNVTCSYDANGNIVCEFAGEHYNSITFIQSGDWSQYDKLKIEFAEASPFSATLSCNGNAQISEGDTEVEVATVNYAYNGNGGPTISSGGMGTTPKTLTIKKVTLIKEAVTPDPTIVYISLDDYLLGETNKVMFYSGDNTNMYGGEIISVSATDWTTEDGYLNLDYFKTLAGNGYHPITGSAFQKWVKWAPVADGYYSDWIVTLTKAERITPPDDYTPQYQGRIMAEDLTANNDPTGKKSDWDFNDVVFDWDIHDGKAYIKLLAAGGTLPLTIGGKLVDGEVVGGVEVHQKFGVSTGTMVNTGLAEKTEMEFVLNDGIEYSNGDANAIKLYVKKGGQWIEITAEQGRPAGKFNCAVGTAWCDEYVDIRRVYPSFAAWVENEKVEWATLATERAVLTDKNLENNDVYPLNEE